MTAHGEYTGIVRDAPALQLTEEDLDAISGVADAPAMDLSQNQVNSLVELADETSLPGDSVSNISDPGDTNSEEVAERLNELLSALRSAGVIASGGGGGG